VGRQQPPPASPPPQAPSALSFPGVIRLKRRRLSPALSGRELKLNPLRSAWKNAAARSLRGRLPSDFSSYFPHAVPNSSRGFEEADAARSWHEKPP